MKKEPIVIGRTYNAPVERVWKAITDREEMRKWYFDIEAFKPEEGFEFRFYGESPKGVKYLHICKITEMVVGRKLAYSWRYDGFDGVSNVSFELFDEGDKTRLRLTHSDIENFPADEADFARENFEEGWTYFIGAALMEYLGK